jgi:hypothetical protein
MSFFDDAWDTVSRNPGRTLGGIAGGMAGLPAGLFGIAGGSLLGSNIGGMVLPGSGGGGGNPYGGMPGYPTYIGMEPDATAVNPGAAMTRFEADSMRNGPSQMTQLALQKNAEGANAARAGARKMAAGTAADAMSNLSMTGGLNAGAAERIQKNATNQALDFSNAADANAGANRAGLFAADEGARTANLGQAANARTALDVGNVQRKQGEFDRRNLYNMNAYNQAMGGWAAGKQADATANSGKHGLFK